MNEESGRSEMEAEDEEEKGEVGEGGGVRERGG